MSKTEETLNPKTPYQDLTIGGNIYTAGNAKEFKTGDWRSQKPVWISEKCKQCGLCWPVCPDDAIPVTKDKKEQISIMMLVKDAWYVQKYVLSKQ